MRKQRKQIFILAIVMITMLFVSNPGKSQSIKNATAFDMQNTSFLDVYKTALDLNKGRFSNLNEIQIGDTVLFPARTINGTVEYWVADTPTAHDGKHDCIWRLTERYLAYELPTKPAVVKPAQPDPVAPAEKANTPWWAWLLLTLAVLLCGAGLYIIIENFKKRRNPDFYLPVMQEGLSRNLEEAARQIANNNNVTPNNVIRTERVVLVRESGPQTLRVEMEFGDNIKRDVDIKSGEVFVLATLRTTGKNTIQELYRNHCGNKTGPVISSGKINTLNRDENRNIVLPRGWRFVKEAEYVRPEANATDAAVSDTTATPVVSDFIPMAPVVDNNFLPTIISSAPKNTEYIDVEITADNISISIKMHNPEPEEVKK